MKDVKLYNVQKDEFGYSIYWGMHTRIETGSPRKASVQKRRIEIIALSRLITKLASEGIEIPHTHSEYPRLESIVRTMGMYYGRNLGTLDKIVASSYKLYKSGL